MGATTPWGQIYVDIDSPVPPANTRVELGYLELHVLTESQGWLCYRWRAGNGYWWPENDYQATRTTADQRVEPDGFTSVTAGDGKVFHFFPPTQTAIDRPDTVGVVAAVSARLIVADASQPDDRASARYLLMAGADWWQYIGAPLMPDYSTNPAAGSGRFKYVTNQWQKFRMSSVLAAELERHPPTCYVDADASP